MGEDAIPLSFSQERMWFTYRFLPDFPASHIPFGLLLEGPLNVEALAKTLTKVIGRHEALRTVYRESDGRPYQVILPPEEITLEPLDLSAVPEAEREKEAVRLAREESRRPFDLSRERPIRVMVYRLAPDKHFLALCIHHISFDGWSTEIFLDELIEVYGALATGLPSPLPDLADHQYREYTLWQLDSGRDEAVERDLAYWKECLAGAPQITTLPPDRPRPPVQSLRGARVEFALPRELSEGVARYCAQARVTPNMLFLAAFQALLHRHTGQATILTGTPIANRSKLAFERIIGLFVNTVVIRADFETDPTFSELVAQVRSRTLDSLQYQDLPFDKLVDGLQPTRDQSRHPIFQVMFAMYHGLTQMPIPGLRSTWTTVDLDVCLFDLLLEVRAVPAGYEGSLWYAVDLFERATIERVTKEYLFLLASALASPDTRVSRLPLLPPEEREKLDAWASTPAQYPRDRTVAELFEAEAARSPGAVAVSAGGKILTYGELDRRAELLAGYLRTLGVGPEVLVGVFLERSAALVVALLAVLKAGGAYVPLDPDYPPERLAFMVRDAQTPVVLTEEKLLPRLAEFQAAQPGGRLAVVCLDRPLPTQGAPPAGGAPSAAAGPSPAAGPSADRPSGPRATPDNLAYVMYTSGSTGVPKGVEVTHRAIARLVKGATFARLAADETLLAFAPACFDASTFEIWGALCNGGRIAVAPPGNLSIEELFQAMRNARVTTAFLTSGLFNLAAESGLESLPALRQLLFGGDVASVPRVERARKALAGRRLANAYGPTENTTFTTTYDVPADFSAKEPRPVPIGRPVGGTIVRILDRWLAPVPVGAPGELCTGGDGLARGYHRRPELTAELFVPDPLAAQPGARLYRTGDICRWLPDGNIEFVGRVDNQVKVRGFRVEPEEIEAVLGAHPGVAEAVVVARTDASGDKRLVAYVVPRAAGEGPAPALTGARLKRYLADRLPEYMVPSVLVVATSLPLGPTGKVDRRNLPEPQAAPAAEADGTSPRTPVEEALASMFRELVEIPDLGIDDSFFDLGGHSLLATRLVSRVRRVFGVELPLREFFADPTVKGLGRRVESLRRGAEAPVRRIERSPREGPLEASFAQERLWFLDRLEPDSPVYNIPLALRLSGPLNFDVLERSLAEIVSRHEALRTVLPAVEGRPAQVVRPFEGLALERIDLGDLPADERETALEGVLGEEALRPFNLSSGPLVRWKLIRLGPAEHVLSVVMHHVIADGWSLEVLFRELAVLYEAFLSGAPSPLPELPVQYADFTSWQRAWLREGELDRQLGYWKDRLSGDLGVVELPTDRQRPATQTFRGATRMFTLPADLTRALRDLAREEGATLFMVLLAALDTLLHRYSGQTDILVGTPIANRNREEIEGLIGFFVNTLVLRVDLGGDPTFRELVARVKEAALGAYDHQDVPFEVLVETLQPVRDVSRPPLFQIMFVLQNMAPPGRDFGGLTAELLGTTTGTAKFDLLFSLTEAGDEIFGGLEYNTDLFDPGTADRLVSHFEAVLRAATAAPDRPLSGIDLLTDEERTRLVREWNQTAADYPRERCLHELVEARAAETPEALAAVFGERELTYRELDRQAGLLAERLRELAVGPEDRVAVAVERSIGVAVAVLGVLKAGAACLALDLSYPRERLRFMVADAGARVAVTQPELAAEVAEMVPEIVVLGGWAGELAEPAEAATREPAGPATGEPAGPATREPAGPATGESAGSATSPPPVDRATAGAIARPASPPAPRPAKPGPENLAYIVYTSGSTGQPKGVAMTHRALVNLFTWQAARFAAPGCAATSGSVPAAPGSGAEEAKGPGIAPGCAAGRTLQFAPLGFDVAFQEMFATWLGGGTVVFVREEDRRDLANLPAILDHERVDRIFVPFVALQELAEAASRRGVRPRTLREVITAGEQLQVTEAMRWLFAADAGRPIRLENQYGPSETHVATAYRLPERAEEWPTLPSIGRPVANARAYVLDKNLAPVPAGVPGELYLGGVPLARGYWNRPDLTAASFVPDPFGPEAGGRLYRTGDLARYRPDGSLDFLGRLDHQVKIRGFRVELGEVEAALVGHPLVREAVVVLREEPPAGKRLVAYVVPVTPERLRSAAPGAPETTVQWALGAGPAVPPEGQPSGRDYAGLVSELLAHLRARLPDYMVPSAIVPVASFPVTPSGKVDRRALMSRPLPGPGKTRAFSAPETAAERAVASIWREVLGVESVGLDDNFFDLGGHSLLLVRVSSRLQEAFGHPFRVVDLFRYTTVRALAGFAAGSAAGAGGGTEAVGGAEASRGAGQAGEREAAATLGVDRGATRARAAEDRRAAREAARRRPRKP